MVELDDSTLIQLSLTGEVARKVLHYLKQSLQASCLGDLLCSHTFIKHYLSCGGAGLEDEEMLMDGSLGGQGASSSSSLSSATLSSSSASSCIMGSVSKKAKKEIPADTGSETESELPSEDDTKYPDDLEEKMKGKSLFQAFWCCFVMDVTVSGTSFFYLKKKKLSSSY